VTPQWPPQFEPKRTGSNKNSPINTADSTYTIGFVNPRCHVASGRSDCCLKISQARQELIVRPPGSQVEISFVKGALRSSSASWAATVTGLSADALTSLDRAVERSRREIDHLHIYAKVGRY